MRIGEKPEPCCAGEQWRCCIEEHNYWVSSCGRVINSRGGLIKPHIRQDGYAFLLLNDGTRAHGHYVHRLVARNFHGRAPADRPCAAHGDGTRSNNHVTNLRWASYAENEADKVMHGTRLHGDTHPLTKITTAQKSALLSDRRAGATQTALASKYGISQAQVWRIVHGK